jgi:ABC-2 type transport system permease protein
MGNIFLVAKREYLEKIRGRAFRISTVLLPFAFAALLGVGYLTNHKAESGKHLAIASDNPQLANGLRRLMLDDKDSKFTIDLFAPATDEERAALLKQVEARSIDGLLSISTSSTGSLTVSYTSRSANDEATIARLKLALNQLVVSQRLTATGMDPAEADALLRGLSIETNQVNMEGETPKSSGRAAAYTGILMAFLLTMTTMLYGLDMARSIIEEKSSRIFEVMLAVVRPEDMLAGKLIGVGAVGLTQIAIWVAAAALLTSSALAAPLLGGNLSIHFSWMEGVFFPLYFVLGFFLYSAFFSGLAATCETAQELQMYMPLAAAPVWLSFGMAPLIFTDPSSVWSMAASFFPPTAPFVMMLRMGLEMPPLWQLAASIGLMILTIWVVLWFSSRLYRVGILMYGKRATLPEIMRWLRYS